MAILPVLQASHPRLRQVASPVVTFNPALLLQLREDLLATMYNAPGIGLAATQVDVHQQIFTLDVSDDQKAPWFIVNPKILAQENPVDFEEGCLSVNGLRVKTNRFSYLKLAYQDLEGQMQTLEAEDLMAICIQHEIDHLNGKIILDHLSPLKREMAFKKVQKSQRLNPPPYPYKD